jgi:hypothetical protein
MSERFSLALSVSVSHFSLAVNAHVHMSAHEREERLYGIEYTIDSDHFYLVYSSKNNIHTFHACGFTSGIVKTILFY